MVPIGFTSQKDQASRDDADENDIDASEDVTKTVMLDHEGTEGGGEINLANESLGTMQVFSLSSFIGEALEHDAILVINELDPHHVDRDRHLGLWRVGLPRRP